MVSDPAEWGCHSSREPETEHRVLLASSDTRAGNVLRD